MNDDLIFELGTPHTDKCPIHGTDAILTEGRWGPYYHCVTPGCTITGTAHDDGRPMGRLVTKDIQLQRVVAHKLLSQIKAKRNYTKDQLYAWLCDVFNAKATPHVSDMGIRELRVLFRVAQKIIKYE